MESKNRPRLKSITEFLNRPIGGQVVSLSTYKSKRKKALKTKKKPGFLAKLLKILNG